MIDIGDTNDRNNSQNTFSLNAEIWLPGATGTSLGELDRPLRDQRPLGGVRTAATMSI